MKDWKGFLKKYFKQVIALLLAIAIVISYSLSRSSDRTLRAGSFPGGGQTELDTDSEFGKEFPEAGATIAAPVDLVLDQPEKSGERASEEIPGEAAMDQEESDQVITVQEDSATEESMESPEEAVMDQEESDQVITTQEDSAIEESMEFPEESSEKEEDASGEEASGPDDGSTADEESRETFFTTEDEEAGEEAARPQGVADMLVFEGPDYKVTASYGEDAGIPAGASLVVFEIKEEAKDYQAYCDQAQAAVAESLAGGSGEGRDSGSHGEGPEADSIAGTGTSTESGEKDSNTAAADTGAGAADTGAADTEMTVSWVRLFDITIEVDGVAVEPQGPVAVQIDYGQAIEQTGEEEVSTVHFEGREEVPVILETQTEGSGETLEQVTFETEGFSVFVVMGTTITKKILASDGADYIITLTCGPEAAIPADAELEVREIPEDSEIYQACRDKSEALLEEDRQVTFARFFDITILKDGREIQPAAPVEVQVELADKLQKNTRAVHFEQEAGRSTTRESDVQKAEAVLLDTSLTEADRMDSAVTFSASGFSIYGIFYTVDFITASGETYTITVRCEEDAGIPEGAELRVQEAAEETEEYDYYYDQTIESLSEGITEEDYVVGLDHARFFDVSIVKDGQEIEPTKPVEVKITYKEPVELTPDAALKVIHFAEGGTEIIEIETEEESVSEIVYEQNGFSVIGTVTETNAYGWPTAVNTQYVMLLQDGDDYYAVAHDGTLRKVYYLNGTVSFMGAETTSLDYLDGYLWNYEVVSSTRHTARLSTYGSDPDRYIDPYYGLLPQNADTPDAVIGFSQRTLSISNGKIYASYYNTSYTLSAEGGSLHRTTLNAGDASSIYFAEISSFTADTSESEMYDFVDINVLIDKWKTEMTQNLIVDKTAEAYDYENRIYQVDLMASSGYHMVSPALALELVVDASRSMFFPENIYKVQVNGKDYTYSNMTGLRSFFANNGPADKNTTYYVITDKNNTATNWAVFYHDANKLTVYKDNKKMTSGWYYTDASYYYAPDDYERNYPTKTGNYCYPLTTSTLSNLNDTYIYTSDEKVEGRPWSRLDYMQIAVEAAARVLFAVDPDAQIGLVTFNKNTHSYGPFTSDQTEDLINSLYNIGLDGGTRHADGLNLAIKEYSGKFKSVKNCQTAVVLITDGAPNGNTWTEIQTAAKNVKAMTNAFGQKTLLYTLGLGLENVGENKAKLADISSEPHSEHAFSAEKSTEIVNFITKIVEGLVIDADLMGNVTDVIDAGFYPVDPDTGMPLESGTWITEEGKVTKANAGDAAGQVNDKDGVWTVEWQNRRIDWPTYKNAEKTEVLYHGWNGRIYVKAREDFLGGNDIPTNGEGSRAEAVSYINRKTGEVKDISSGEAERIKSFHTPYVHVDELLFDENRTEWTVYLGQSIDPKEQLQKLIESVQVYEVVKDDGSLVYTLSPESVTNLSAGDKTKTGKTFPLSTVIGQLTEDDWNDLISGKTLEVDYKAYGHVPGAVTLALTQTVVEGEEDLTVSPHDTAVTGEEVEKYELTITYEPFAPAVVDYHTGNMGSGSHGADTDDIVSDNGHVINVFAKGLHITKTDEGFNQVLTGAEFVLYRTAREADADSDITSPEGLSGSWYPAATLDCSKDGTASLDTVEKLREGETYYLAETVVPAGCIGISPIPVVINTTDYYIQPAGSADPADRSMTRPASGLYDWEQTATLSLGVDSGIRRTSDAANAKDLTHSGVTENSDNEILYYRIANSGGYELPSTGGPGTSLLLRLTAALGAVLTVLAAALLTRTEAE